MDAPILPPHLMPAMPAPTFTPPRPPVASTSTRPPIFHRTPSLTPTPTTFSAPTPSLDGDAETGEKPKPRKRKRANPDQKPPKRVRTGQVALGETARQARVAINKRRTVLDVAEPATPAIVLSLRALEQEAAAIDLRGDDEDPDLLKRIAEARTACDAALKDYTDASTARGLVKRAQTQSELIDTLTVRYNKQWGQAMLEGQMLSAIHRVIYHRLVDLQSKHAERANERRAAADKIAKAKSAPEPKPVEAEPEPAPPTTPPPAPIEIEDNSEEDDAAVDWSHS